MSTQNSYCRACMIPLIDSQAHLSMFDNHFCDDNKSYLFSELFMITSNILIARGDGLSTHLCDPCTQKVINCFEFRLQCEKTKQALYFMENDCVAINNDEIPTENEYILADHFLHRSSNSKSIEPNVLGRNTPADDDCELIIEPHVIGQKQTFVDSLYFRCDKCSYVTADNTMFQNHKATHVTYKCNICDAKFEKKYKYTNHKLQHFSTLDDCPFCKSIVSPREDGSLLQAKVLHIFEEHSCATDGVQKLFRYILRRKLHLKLLNKVVIQKMEHYLETGTVMPAPKRKIQSKPMINNKTNEILSAYLVDNINNSNNKLPLKELRVSLKRLPFEQNVTLNGDIQVGKTTPNQL